MTEQPSAELAEIWSLFAQEGAENLATAEEALLQFEQDPDNAEQVKVLFRTMHSFKGGVRMMGLSTVESLAHHAEDLIAQVRDDGVTLQADMIDLLLTVLDRLRAMLARVLTEQHDVAPDQATDLIEKLQQVIVHHAPAVQAPVVERLDATEQPHTEVETTKEIAPVMQPVDIAADAPRVKPNLTSTDNADNPGKFLRRTESNLAQLHTALDALEAGAPEALAHIHSMAQALKVDADGMGYRRLGSILDELDRATRTEAANNIEEMFLRFKKIELGIFEELTHIQDRVAAEPIVANSGTDIAWLFRHWNAERVFADLARLTQIADTLDQQSQQVAVETLVARQSQKLAEEAGVLLKAICHSCIFYHLDPAAHLSLALADIYGRIAQGELIANDAHTRLTRAYVTCLGGTIDAIQEGAIPAPDDFAKLIEQAQNFIYLHIDGPVFQVTRNVLDVLKLPAEFKEVMTPETMTKFSRALQAGEHFYTVLADLERDEALGTAFLAWSQSEGIHLLTSITAYRYQRTLFNFLVATPQSREAILASLVQMDPQWQYLTLEECVLHDPSDLNVEHTTKPTRISETGTDIAAAGGADVSAELVETIGETISALVADHATLTRVVKRLIDKDLLETLSRVFVNAHRDVACARRDLEESLHDWIQDIQTLSQVESHVTANLGELQQATRSLRLVPVSEMLNPLRRMAQELAQCQGRLVELDLQGTELTMDRGVIQCLEEPVRRLVWFAVTHSIEDVEHRRAVGKPAVGHVRVKVSQGEDHVQAMIEDDGRGLDQEAIRQRTRELGWANETGNVACELDVILKPGFGLVGKHESAEGIDLAAIGEQLRARHGRFSVQSEEGNGTHFEIRLPLDMAIVDGMIVRVGDVRYVVPVSMIRRVVEIDLENLIHTSAEGNHVLVKFEGELVPIQALANDASLSDDQHLLVVVDNERGRRALLIDELVGRQQVLVRPLRGQWAQVQDVSGCALLGEGGVGVVLDLARYLANEASPG